MTIDLVRRIEIKDNMTVKELMLLRDAGNITQKQFKEYIDNKFTRERQLCTPMRDLA